MHRHCVSRTERVRTSRRAGVAALALVLVWAGRGAPAQSTDCVGDVNGNGVVTVDELILGVNIALEERPVTDAPVFDANADGRVTVNELVQAVGYALTSCPLNPPPLSGDAAVQASSRVAITNVGAIRILDFGVVGSQRSGGTRLLNLRAPPAVAGEPRDVAAASARGGAAAIEPCSGGGTRRISRRVASRRWGAQIFPPFMLLCRAISRWSRISVSSACFTASKICRSESTRWFASLTWNRFGI